MKFFKMFAVVAVIFIVSIQLFLVQPANAATTKILGLVDCNPTALPSTSSSCNLQKIVEALQSVVKFLMPFVISLAVIFIVAGGFVIMTAGGNATRMASGKKIIWAAIIGLILFLGSSLIVKTIYNVFQR